MREYCEQITKESPFISVLSDGSQARKTKEDKELLFARVVKNGSPTYMLLTLLNMSEYGGTDANSIKSAIDGVFDAECGDIKLTEGEYRRKLISSTADGASVNFGAFQGVLTQLAENRDWLIKIHCVNHRVELAAKKVINESVFTDVEQFYLSIYFFLNNSGRFHSECKQSAEAQNVDFKELPKIHGTRFLGHKRNGISNFLFNWPIFEATCENAVALVTRCYNPLTKAKISGFLIKFRNYRLLMLTAVYLDLLEKVTPMSKIFEGGDILPCDVNVAVKHTVLELRDLADVVGTPEEFLDSHVTKFRNIVTSDSGRNFIAVEYVQRGHMRKKANNRQCTTVNITNLTHATEEVAVSASQQKKNVALRWIDILEKRFTDFRNDVFKDMEWLDRSSWSDESTYADENILNIAAHFDSPLNFSGFDIESVIKEWKSCKRYVMAKFPELETTNSVIWHHILTRKKYEFPNLSLVVSLLLSISVSNSTVERGFSILTLMMSDRRLGLSHEALVDVMRIKTNDKLWSMQERDNILSRAIELYRQKRRSLVTTTQEDGNSKRKEPDEEEIVNCRLDESDVEIDFDDIVL